MVPPNEETGPDPVRTRLAELAAIERLIAESLDGWADRLREHPEATAVVDRLRTISESRQPLEPALDAVAGVGPAVRAGSPVPGVAGVSHAASDVVRQIGQVALAATFACETAHQTARLLADGDTCDLVEARLGEYAATLFDTRRVLPHVVARELRLAGVTCACRCPACSIGLCGCIRATSAATEVRWGGEEPARTEGLVLLGPPRPGSQLAEAGLDEGDRVLAVDGDPVGRNADAQAALRRHEVGDEVRLAVERRDGDRIEVTVRRVG
jgi:membrane-associated protease RseP (regulator of RpoE activity)